MNRKHVFRKAGTNDEGGRILRVWVCACGASKRRVTRKPDPAPRSTVERSAASTECTARRAS